MKLRERKRPRTEKRSDIETISNRTLLVLYLTCVRHPYLYPALRVLCKALRDDSEVEIEYFKYTTGCKRSYSGWGYVLERLEMYVDSLSTETLMDYIIHIAASESKNSSDIEASEMKSRVSEILMRMKESEKHKDAIEGRVRCHYHSLEKCTEALKWACRNGLFDIVRMLLADPRVDPSACNAIAWASENGNAATVKLLLANPRVDPSASNQEAIRWASGRGHTEIIRMLLADPRIDPSVDNQYALRRASIRGQIDIARMLLADSRVDPSARNQDAIYWASKNGHTEIVRILLADPRVDPSANNQYALRVASWSGHTEIARVLLADPRVDPSANDQQAIRWASRNGHIEIVRMLLADPRVTMPE
jgi:Ankyrin repeats (3 copies)